jgi:hypothetical protein
MTTESTQRFSIVPVDEANIIKAGTNAEWFERLMDGAMLKMLFRPTLTKPMLERMDARSFRMRTKQASKDEGFYVWMESKQVADARFPTDENVDTTLAEDADDFDPLAEVESQAG